MRARSRGTAALAALVLSGTIAATAGAGAAAAAPTTAAARAMVPKLAAAPLDKILARPGGLYDSATGVTFTPRGTNNVQLATYSNGSAYHSTFEPSLYTSAHAQAVLDNMKTSSGYNTVRAFIDPGQFITPSHGISTSVASTAPALAVLLGSEADHDVLAY